MQCDLEMPVFYNWTEPVARRRHVCCECDAPIEKGERYFTATGKWDGRVSTYKQHLVCLNACMFVRDKLNGGDCICFGGLKEFHNESSRYMKERPFHPSWAEFRRMLYLIKRREHFAKSCSPCL